MQGIAQGYRGNPVFLRFGHRNTGGEISRNLPHRSAAVYHCGAGTLIYNGALTRPGIPVSVLDPVYVLLEPKQAMRVVAEEAGLNQVIDHLARVVLREPAGHEQLVAEFPQGLRRKGGHRA